MDKLVSIIMPTYNGSKWLKNAIESVISQSYQNWELLVLNDGSSDNTDGIMTLLTQNEPRIRYIKNDTNLGIQKTLNKGLREAKGEYIARIDDDDSWVDADKLKKQVAFLEQNSDCVLVGTGAILINEDGQEISRFLMPEKDIDIRRKILLKNCFLHSSVLFKKSVALQFSGYNESKKTRHIEDYDLWLRLGTCGEFANLNIYAVSLMQREGTISNKNRIIQARRSIAKVIKFRNEYPYFLFGFFFSIARYFFFLVQKIIPINEKAIHTLKKKYKEF